MKELQLQHILELAGVACRQGSELAQFDAWIGSTDQDDGDGGSYNGLTLEDCAPLSTQVYQELAALLASSWKPSVESDWRRNLLLESDADPKEIRLVDVYDSIQATKWTRLLIDLHVDETSSSSQILMQNETWIQSLIPALYHHINNLPLLQSHVHQYKQTLQQQPVQGGGQRRVGTRQIDPKERLEAYERAQQVLDRLLMEWNQHTQQLEDICIAWYRAAGRVGRELTRKCLGRVWSDYVYRSESMGGGGLRQENTQAAGIHITLKTLDKILAGVTTVLDSHERLLTQHLIPLHRPNGLVLWRDQTPVLQLYHQSLTRCCALILQRKTSLIPLTIQALLHKDIFPPAGNTGKQVLLLHEIDTYLGLLPSEEWLTILKQQQQQQSSHGSDWLMDLTRTLARCMSSEHSAVAERALQFSKSKVFNEMVKEKGIPVYRVLLPALVRKEPSWNPTVRKMTYLTLKTLQENNEDYFTEACNLAFGSSTPIHPARSRQEVGAKVPLPQSATAKRRPGFQPTLDQSPHPPTVPNASAASSSSLSMPPPLAMPRKHNSRPLSSIPGKGVAPWSAASGQPPPLTITGVAPWAMQPQAPGDQKSLFNKRRIGQSQLGALQEKNTSEEPGNPKGLSGFDRVVAYMEKLKPADEGDGTQSWSIEQMAETPTLLPDLKFHDLVFGQDLGEGAFGSVRYARLIDRSKTRSNWNEYAVKVISTEKIQEFGYEYSVKREIAVLRMLSHPGIARLVSSFRFREGAYLVLEYASGGDLHDFLRKKGSLDEDSTRFVIGEVMAGLQSIHDLGLVHIDLKAENILITESGHIKLTDFGGCRPVTPEAKDRVAIAARNAIRDLRNGDWKMEAGARIDQSKLSISDGSPNKGSANAKAFTNETMDIDEEMDEDDGRLEGTTANLPPEIVLGGNPSFSTDSWALGCVMYQCLTGRPPLLEADESTTKQKIVQFASSNDDKPGEAPNDYDELFNAPHAASISQNARGLIRSLLERDVTQRPSIAEAAMHEFFNGVDVFAMYQQPAYPLDVGSNAPSTTDAKWSRRQFSTIWAPQPAAYDLSPTLDLDDHSRATTALFSAPIPEGDEAGGHFTPIRTREGVAGPGFIPQTTQTTSATETEKGY